MSEPKVNRATVIEWLDANEIEVTHTQLAGLFSSAIEAAQAQEDAERWQFLAEYLVGTRTDLDDEIVGCDSVQKMARVLDAARAAQKGNHD